MDEVIFYLVNELNKIYDQIAKDKVNTGNDNTFMWKDIIDWLKTKITIREHENMMKEREEILSKLTDREKEILGLKTRK